MSTPRSRARTGNRILDRLPADEHSRIVEASQIVALTRGQDIYQERGPMTHAYFPFVGMYSVVVPLEDGRIVEAATVGNEGMVGIPLAFGLEFSPDKVISQVSGSAIRVPARAFLRSLSPGSALERLVRRYASYRTRYANQTIACNIFHDADQRMCRWLLMTHDRAGRDQFTLTHEFLSEMMGMRRQTVSLVAARLQRAGLIDYHRGLVRVLDRKGLEERGCECFRACRAFYQQIMA
jgi:CRP-like cAMP-binding protein